MRIEQIRNATIKIHYAGKTFLVDPWLAPKGSMGCFADLSTFRVCHKEQARIPMPMCALPFPTEKVLEDVDAYIVTHVHPDHIDMNLDGTIKDYLKRDVATFVQSDEDAIVLQKSGFGDVRTLGANSSFGDIQLMKTPGLHGTLKPCGPSCGVVFRHPEEKTLYVAGDTIWYSEVERSLASFRPDVVVLNACAAELEDYGRLIMDDHDVAMVHKAAPCARVIVSHMDTVAHASITRATMRERLQKLGIWDAILMPADGESLSF